MSENVRERIRKRFERLAVIAGCVGMIVGGSVALFVIEDAYLTKRAELAANIYDTMMSSANVQTVQFVKRRMPPNGISQMQKSKIILEAWKHGKLPAYQAKRLTALREWTPRTISLELGALAGGFVVAWGPVRAIGWGMDALF